MPFSMADWSNCGPMSRSRRCLTVTGSPRRRRATGTARSNCSQLRFVGSIKWLEGPFDDHDLQRLIKHRSALTDRVLPLVAVSRSGVSCSGVTAYGPDDLVRAWR
ncbi:hypothetical protein IMZ11_16225 [Microtetraspora sp. AC03309]|uniref:hypothetical protein n=1 Tax=Microtetraspora sp. AC03309 TaxID=2779376 RepID=UPI001E2CA3C9|nr:hypothetical protein [Microtetraspora sp. AC03309]MCC5577174.1 hypothetical protein [Microtetraspora sp. AC03309]